MRSASAGRLLNFRICLPPPPPLMNPSQRDNDFGPPAPNVILIPSYVGLASLVWVIHDYFVTLEDEVTYFWAQKPQFGILTFFWIRYYTMFLVLFDTLGVHTITSQRFIIYSLFLGAINLWSIEVVMQLRVYMLFNRSKRVAFANGVLFIISIGIFLWILIYNQLHRNEEYTVSEVSWVTPASGLPPLYGPPPGLPPPTGPPPRPMPVSECSSVNADSRWAQWIPPTLFEIVLFGMAVYKTIVSSSAKVHLNGRRSLTAILLHENIVYFFVAMCVLVFNNLMFVCQKHIPWLGFGPFHAGLGIATGRMLIHLREFASENLEARGKSMADMLPNFEVDLPEIPGSSLASLVWISVI